MPVQSTPQTTLPYGAWPSKISPDILTSGTPSFEYVSSDGDKLYWLESRPWENGRTVVIEYTPGLGTRDVLPAPLSARSKVHEYGGTPYIVVDGRLYFCLYDDQRIYQIDLNNENTLPTPLTPENNWRFADFCYDRQRHRLICVCEDHSVAPEPENFIAAVSLDGSNSVSKLISGDDFYGYPRLNPAGDSLCWISWNHPDMPWDNTALWLSELDAQGNAEAPQLIAGGDDESIFQPQWSPKGELYFVSDRSNWWNIYCYQSDTGVTPIHPMDAEFAKPLWVLGMSSYGITNSGDLICCYNQRGSWSLAHISRERIFTPLNAPYSDITGVHCAGDNAWFIGSSPSINGEIVQLEISTKALTTLHQPSLPPLDASYLSQPEEISFPSGDGEIAHGFFYPPTNPHFKGPDKTAPPLVVVCHGGPTGATSTSLNYKIQYWCSRGFALLDVNYRGSTGYGREYRNRLNYNWGIVDLEDVVAGTDYLIEQQLVDPEKVAIRGSSAGGYTVLAALTFSDRFKAGACLYGIGNLESLTRDTHKFESRYLDTLIGEYPAQRAIYHQRSPIHYTDQLQCPVIFLQGLDDKVVPPEQALSMAQALRDKQLPVAYLAFPGEGHGFRKAETIKRAIEAELYFYSRVFGFEPGEDVPAIPIANLGEASK